MFTKSMLEEVENLMKLGIPEHAARQSVWAEHYALDREE